MTNFKELSDSEKIEKLIGQIKSIESRFEQSLCRIVSLEIIIHYSWAMFRKHLPGDWPSDLKKDLEAIFGEGMKLSIENGGLDFLDLIPDEEPPKKKEGS